jgi:hypothetical protein
VCPCSGVLPGLFTDVPEFEHSIEAQHLGEVEERAAELVASLTGQAPGSFRLHMVHAGH